MTAAGGAVDAWVYIAHGHVFGNAQTGNVVLMAIALAEGDWRGAFNHLPSLLEHVPEKCKRFSDKNMLQLIDFERVLLPNATPRLANAL